jgi:hypothetical protein
MNEKAATARRSAKLETPTSLGAKATRDISGALNALLADFFSLYPADRRRKPGLRHVDSRPGPDREPAAKTEAHLDSGRPRD